MVGGGGVHFVEFMAIDPLVGVEVVGGEVGEMSCGGRLFTGEVYDSTGFIYAVEFIVLKFGYTDGFGHGAFSHGVHTPSFSFFNITGRGVWSKNFFSMGGYC